jgi:uncharacterized protein
MSASTILTLTNGCGIDLLNPKASDIDFDSYAEQLAKESRFNGATPGQQYSVAEHLARGVEAILERSGDEVLAAYWSLHDAPEACLKDDTTPKKRALAELCEQEFGVLAANVIDTFDGLTARHDAVIHEAAGLPWPIPEPEIAGRIKFWDMTMFVTEWRDLMRDRPHPNWAPFSGIKPLVERIRPWRWEVAKVKLISCWERVLPALLDRQGDEILRREVDQWDQRRLRIKQRYIDEGMPEDAADDKATDEVRREIRSAP